MAPTDADRAIADALVDRLAKVFDVQRAIWFGSRAKGEGTVDSDWDLLVVALSELEPFARVTAALRATRDLHVSRDVFVATPDEFAQTRDVCGTVAYAATRQGLVLRGNECVG
ncbi:MAG: nucleotidyltransferase domain-containing protein [Myxococcales bacterium]|nr:nucleotidyltransferase domain-containing protein [Myxococcales bacterium]